MDEIEIHKPFPNRQALNLRLQALGKLFKSLSSPLLPSYCPNYLHSLCTEVGLRRILRVLKRDTHCTI